MKTYPRIERAPYRVEVPRPRNGRPGYAWVQGWRVARHEGDESGIGAAWRTGKRSMRRLPLCLKGRAMPDTTSAAPSERPTLLRLRSWPT